MACCYRQVADQHFGAKRARRDLAAYHRRGPINTTRRLLAAIRATGLRDATLLDIGAGIGALGHELVGTEIASAVLVEASRAFLAEARAEADRRGHAAAIRFVEGDFVTIAANLPPADVVTLDRVICCYPDAERLVTGSAAKALRLYGFSVPHDRWYVRAAMALDNLRRAVAGNAFRAFVHPVATIDRLLRDLGFRPRSVRRTVMWHVALYERQGAGGGRAGAP